MMHSEKPEKLVRWFIEETNNIIARECELYPETFRGVCGLPQNIGVAPERSLDELERLARARRELEHNVLVKLLVLFFLDV